MTQIPFFPELDIAATKKLAKRKLREFRRWERVSGLVFEQNITATYSFEPRQKVKAPSKSLENLAIRKIDAQNELFAIEDGINRIIDPYTRQILFMKYCSHIKMSDLAIYDTLHYSESEFYRLLDKGLLHFAEGYRDGVLLQYKS